MKINTEPEVFWCSYCGKNIWAIPNNIVDPNQLICSECKDKLIKDKDKPK